MGLFSNHLKNVCLFSNYLKKYPWPRLRPRPEEGILFPNGLRTYFVNTFRNNNSNVFHLNRIIISSNNHHLVRDASYQHMCMSLCIHRVQTRFMHMCMKPSRTWPGQSGPGTGLGLAQGSLGPGHRLRPESWPALCMNA